MADVRQDEVEQTCGGSAPVKFNEPRGSRSSRRVFFKCGAHTKPTIEPRARSPGSSRPERHPALPPSQVNGSASFRWAKNKRQQSSTAAVSTRPSAMNHGHLTLLSAPFPKHLSAVSSVFPSFQAAASFRSHPYSWKIGQRRRAAARTL